MSLRLAANGVNLLVREHARQQVANLLPLQAARRFHSKLLVAGNAAQALVGSKGTLMEGRRTEVLLAVLKAVRLLQDFRKELQSMLASARTSKGSWQHIRWRIRRCNSGAC